MLIKRTPETTTCCYQPLNELVQQSLILFNQQAFFACHELLEEAWLRAAGPCRQLYQGMLQLSVAFYHIQQKNSSGALKVLKRAQMKFVDLPDHCQGIDIAYLRSICQEFEAALQTFPHQKLPPFPTIIPEEI